MLLEFMELGGMTGTPKGIIEKMVSAILVVIRPLAVQMSGVNARTGNVAGWKSFCTASESPLEGLTTATRHTNEVDYQDRRLLTVPPVPIRMSQLTSATLRTLADSDWLTAAR